MAPAHIGATSKPDGAAVFAAVGAAPEAAGYWIDHDPLAAAEAAAEHHCLFTAHLVPHAPELLAHCGRVLRFQRYVFRVDAIRRVLLHYRPNEEQRYAAWYLKGINEPLRRFSV